GMHLQGTRHFGDTLSAVETVHGRLLELFGEFSSRLHCPICLFRCFLEVNRLSQKWGPLQWNPANLTTVISPMLSGNIWSCSSQPPSLAAVLPNIRDGRSSMASVTPSAAAALGNCFLTTCRLGVRFTITSGCGAARVCGKTSMAPCGNWYAKRRGETTSPTGPFWIASPLGRVST